MNELVSFAVVPLFAAVLFGAPHVLTLTFNAAVSRQMTPVTSILSLGFYWTTLMITPLMFCLATNRADIPDLVNRKVTVVVVPCTLGLCTWFGALGAAISVLLYQILVFFMTPIFCRECLNTPVMTWMKQLKPMWVASITSYLPGLLLLHFVAAPSLKTSAAIFALSSSAFCVWAAKLLTPGLRSILARQFGGRLGTLAGLRGSA